MQCSQLGGGTFLSSAINTVDGQNSINAKETLSTMIHNSCGTDFP
jgi:hypothetical protein